MAIVEKGQEYTTVVPSAENNTKYRAFIDLDSLYSNEMASKLYSIYRPLGIESFVGENRADTITFELPYTAQKIKTGDDLNGSACNKMEFDCAGNFETKDVKAYGRIGFGVEVPGCNTDLLFNSGTVQANQINSRVQKIVKAHLESELKVKDNYGMKKLVEMATPQNETTTEDSILGMVQELNIKMSVLQDSATVLGERVLVLSTSAYARLQTFKEFTNCCQNVGELTQRMGVLDTQFRGFDRVVSVPDELLPANKMIAFFSDNLHAFEGSCLNSETDRIRFRNVVDGRAQDAVQVNKDNRLFLFAIFEEEVLMLTSSAITPLTAKTSTETTV